ncbi:MAG TPA: penicillin acylase family protein [Thermoleophilaceae bacterium]
MRRGTGGFWKPAAVAAVLALAAPGVAVAQEPLTVPAFEGFNSVLAQGEGESIEAPELAANQASGALPDTFVNQQPLYVDIMPRAATLGPGDIGRFYKDSRFGAMPGGVGSTTTPRPGVRILRDARFGVAHIYGDTREDLMFGNGYATAQERLFMMDAIRRTARGTLAGLTGASAAEGDAEQLTDQDFSGEELTRQFEALGQRWGGPGERAKADILNYVAGINKRIDEVNADPTQMPAEYPALGARPEPWTVADSVAMATLLVTQFTVSNGGEEVNSQLRQGFERKFGKGWQRPYRDLREADDPEALTVSPHKHLSDRPGRLQSGRNAIPDFGSIRPRDPQIEGPGAGDAQAASGAGLPAWVHAVNRLKKALPDEESNAVIVPRKLSSTGHALYAAGPQVDYWSPQIFVEQELHGGGIDVEGVSFPGASPWPLIGHGVDFVWSGTSANGDNQDTFVESLCNPDGSAPSDRSTHYTYRGQCRPFTTRDQTVTTPVSPIDPSPPERITQRTMRSVHGPVFAFATVGGKPVALAKAKGVDFHELDASIPFMRLAENEPRSLRAFMKVMSPFPGTENWFYANRDEVGFVQSGNFQKHAPGSDVDLPYNGDGSGDWVGFDPDTYSFETIPPANRPHAANEASISWNNKEGIGWRKGPTEWSDGPVHHALLLRRRLEDEQRVKGGKVDLVGLTRAVNRAATGDLRPEEPYRWMRQVIGRAQGRDEKMLRLIDAWRADGGNRLDKDGDNVYEHSAAVILMDAWWPRFVQQAFQPELGPDLFGAVEDRVLGLGGFGWGWASHVQKDLRNVLGRKVRGRYSRFYCGGRPTVKPLTGSGRAVALKRCRAILLHSLRQAVQGISNDRGADVAEWKYPATCPLTRPRACVQKEPTAAGAVETPPFPWQNRGTFHQVTEVLGRR